jgi:exodeoxyribonuclease VII small subunit
MTFEESMQNLEAIVKQLEEGKLPLEEAIQAFEKGMSYKRNCEEKLKMAQLKIEQIISAEADPKPFINAA